MALEPAIGLILTVFLCRHPVYPQLLSVLAQLLSVLQQVLSVSGALLSVLEKLRRVDRAILDDCRITSPLTLGEDVARRHALASAGACEGRGLVTRVIRLIP